MASKQTPGMKGSKATKEERRAQAREKARILREQEQKRAKRNKILALVGAAVLLALVVFAIVQVVTADDSNLGDYDGEARSAQLANVDDDMGIFVTADGAATDDPIDAPVIGIWSDYMCGGCQTLDLNYQQLFQQYAAGDQLQFKLYAVETLGTKLSSEGAAALYYLATYSPEHVWEYNQKLMERGDETNSGSAQLPSAAELADIALEVGVPEDIVNDLPASINSSDWKEHVQSTTSNFRDNGYSVTPTITVDGEVDDSWLAGGGSGIPGVLQNAAGGPPAGAETAAPAEEPSEIEQEPATEQTDGEQEPAEEETN